MPEAGPFGETFFVARAFAMADALFLKRPSSGWVESVSTFADHFVVVAMPVSSDASPIAGSLCRMRAWEFSLRRLRKKAVRRVPHSSARRLGTTSTLWLSWGWFMTERTEPHAPALGSRAA